jgi:PKD repeat protein
MEASDRARSCWVTHCSTSAAVKFIFITPILLFLSACGGSGGGDDPPADKTAPKIEALDPTGGSDITDITQSLTFKVTDTGGSGVDTASIVVMANGADRSNEAVFASDVLTLTPTTLSRWQRGGLDITITLKDKSANTADADFSYTVTPVTQALPRAVPPQGNAPLTVSFYPDVSLDAVIESYDWDFDGDDIYDISETIGRVQTYVFNTPGTYSVKLKVTDASGNESIGEVSVVATNAPPQVVAEAQPSNGGIPLTVSFTVTAIDNEGITSYAWDFDGDGNNEETSTTTGDITYEYTTPGVYRPILTVIDTAGETTKLQVPSIDVRVGPVGSPSISAGANPIEGKAPLSVNFTARVSDPDSQVVSQWEWDFEDNGTFDYNSATSGDVSHDYIASGTYYARVRVTLADGDTAEDVVQITVLQDLSLALSTDTLDATLDESVTITTTLGGASKVSLLIENTLGQTVRTLVSIQQRAGGSYDDIWDGKDEQGNPVPDGQYRAILVYEENGETKRFDLGLITGGQESNPTGNYANRFAPFSADPLEIEYSLDQASEVTAFMGYLGVGTRRLFTFYQRKPQGRGSHQIIWNGENKDGVLVKPPEGSSGFLVGLFAYTLPDNAIYVKNSIELSTLIAMPPVLTPDSVTPDGTVQQSILQFELSDDARITHTINNTDTGAEVFRKTHDNIEAGFPQLPWDGRANNGEFVAPGNYRHGITALDARGNKSPTLYTLQRVYY